MRSQEIISGETIFAGLLNAIRSDARAASWLHPHQQLGVLALGTIPTANQTVTLTINGTAVVFTAVSTIGTTAGNVLIGGSAAAFVANLMTLLKNPYQTTTTGVALSPSNQLLLSYLSFDMVAAATTITICSLNSTSNVALTSITVATTVTSGTWTGNTMALYVEPGVAFVNGTKVIFTGGVTPTVTAPSSHPRIDVLTIDSTGTLAWTTGTENASPVVPTYPSNKMALCELYNVTGETSLGDNGNQVSGQGYIYNDVRNYMQNFINLAALPDSILPSADATYNLGSASFEWNNIYAKTGIFVNNVGVAIAKFGGTGTSGALSITSGTTTISCSGNSYLEENYTSISITSSGNLAFSSPNNTTGTTVNLRSQGNVTITTSSSHAIDMRNMGGGLGNGGDSYTGGTVGASSGGGGGAGGGSGAGQGGDGGAPNATYYIIVGAGGRALTISPWMRMVLPGGNGSAGGSSSTNGGGGSGGSGGLGAGGLLIECAGAYNFTTGTIDLTAANGANGGTVSGSPGQGAGGGGGGGGGNIIVLYGSLTANSGTYAVTAGTGGTGSNNGGASGGNGGAGAAGLAIVALNTYFS